MGCLQTSGAQCMVTCRLPPDNHCDEHHQYHDGCVLGLAIHTDAVVHTRNLW